MLEYTLLMEVIMYYGLLLLVLCGYSQAFDDVFTDIPSQFSGYSYFVGLETDSQAGQLEYINYQLQGPTDPRLKIAMTYQKESDLWVSGWSGFVMAGGWKHTVFEQLGASTVTVEYPYGYGVSYRKGFLFNPSTLCALSISLGNEHVSYRYSNTTFKDHNLFLMGGVDVVVGVLTEWAMEVGVGVAASDAKSIMLSTTNKYQPPQYIVSGRVGAVYRKEQELDF